MRTSCGAITGLPYLFCGMMRSLHLLLRCDFSGALYFNWLALPLAIVMVFLIALFGAEMACRRQILNLRVLAPTTARRLAACAATAVALWALHAYLAVSQHKAELQSSRAALLPFRSAALISHSLFLNRDNF